MKCENCGGNLTLEDVVCPYCEALNQHAVEHIREMNRYKKDFEGTKEEVYSVTKNYAGISVRVIIIAVILILTIICGLLSGEAYSIRRHIKEAQRNDAKCKEIMDQYLEERNYYAFSAFCNENYIDVSDENYEEYKSILYATNYYTYLYDNIMRTVKPYEGADMNSYKDWITQYLNEFYKIFDDEDYWHYVGTSGETYEEAVKIRDQIHALLVAYCGVSKEEVERFPEMSSAERALAIEEGMKNE